MDRDEVRRQVEAAVAAGDYGAAEELMAAKWRLWFTTGDIQGGRALLAIVLDRRAPEATRGRALALYADGLMAFRQGDRDGSLARNEEALEVAKAAGDSGAESLALVGLSRVAFRDGRYGDVVALARGARRLAGDDPDAQAWPLHMEAAGTRLSGDYEGARALYRESIDLNRSRGDRDLETMELHNLAHVELHCGDLAAAEELLARWRERTADSEAPYDRAMAALNDAALAAAHGELRRAAGRLARAESRLADAGIVLDPDDAFEVEDLRGRLA